MAKKNSSTKGSKGSKAEAATDKSTAGKAAEQFKPELGSLATSFENAKSSAQVMATTSEEFRESL